MKESEEIIQALLKFRNERDWEQFHNPKDLALAISIESAELLELFLWKKADEANTEKVKEELADIFSFAFSSEYCGEFIHVNAFLVPDNFLIH